MDYLTKGELDDTKKMARDVSNIGLLGNGDYEVHLKVGMNLDYLMSLIRQAYSKQVSLKNSANAQKVISKKSRCLRR